ncbi:hypothetical protein [Moraxella bovoculi]|uniref:hypothetical protein n=1 Tax=Moraxella bovoculi TaxID=386891 RepID=UPI000624BAD9|nr:hypothetical protein [Moraxella bovoculi]AKG15988.1 hypothetical protein AAX08_08895 [Moraxella bovoculi]AKG17675.1 hypothetical protein AAX10_08535 [Moraxella bovoculi]
MLFYLIFAIFEYANKEQEKLDENLQTTGKITAAAGVQVVATTANVLTDNCTGQLFSNNP